MSGTSMDGLDIIHVEFTLKNQNDWDYEILHCETFQYSENFRSELANSTSLDVPDFLMLDKKIGIMFGNMVTTFINKYNINKTRIKAIASHGHTTHHQPNKGFTAQIGCGSTIAFITGIPVINDFRSKDVIAGGQGAPLVPIGDLLLFKNIAESFLNLGGIANISFMQDKKMIAFDICPANLPLNKIVAQIDLNFDENGEIAKKGEINQNLLKQLNNLNYYSENPPKSLGTEWIQENFNPLINFTSDIENNLATVIEHEAFQIAKILNTNQLASVLISGGGAKNNFIIERIKAYYNGEVILPNEKVIEFKEALIFAFLGALYLEKTNNTLSSVTGASRDVIGGVYHLPN